MTERMAPVIEWIRRILGIERNGKNVEVELEEISVASDQQEMDIAIVSFTDAIGLSAASLELVARGHDVAIIMPREQWLQLYRGYMDQGEGRVNLPAFGRN